MATGVDARDHAVAEVYRAEDLTFHANDVAGLLVDPHSAAQTGEGFRGEVWRIPGGVGGEVEDDEGRAVRGVRGGLIGGSGEEHGVRHEADEIDSELFVGCFTTGVVGELAGRVEQLPQAVAFGCVFVRREGLAIFLAQAGDIAAGVLDNLAGAFSFLVDGVHLITEQGGVMRDGTGLICGREDSPLPRGTGGCGMRCRLWRGAAGRARAGCH